MKAGITGFGAYIPWRRLNREVVAQANAWFAPNIKGKGHKAMANWDEDSITMAVAAARDILGPATKRCEIGQLLLASTTLPFSDRLNSGVVSEALNLPDTVQCTDLGGSLSSGLSAIEQATALAEKSGRQVLVAAADSRKTLAGSPQELTYGDGAAALTIGCENVLADIIGEASVTVDFIDHYRQSDNEIDYYWEERWVRDEGVSKFVPQVVSDALELAGVAASEVNHFIFPTTFKRMEQQVAKTCGIDGSTIVDNHQASVGDVGTAQGILMLTSVLEKAQPGDVILLCQFGFGAKALVFKVTDHIRSFKPVVGFSGWLHRKTEETSYTRYLAYKKQIKFDLGMRGEQDKKTALSTAFRYRKALLGLVGGRCRETGEIHYPPTRLSYTPGAPKLDTQEPYPLADKGGRILSWSAEYLSSDMSPPHQYGQIDFNGGGRLLMDFTDVEKGDVETGLEVETVFRIKDIDDLRGFKRYFWKATPVKQATQLED